LAAVTCGIVGGRCESPVLKLSRHALVTKKLFRTRAPPLLFSFSSGDVVDPFDRMASSEGKRFLVGRTTVSVWLSPILATPLGLPSCSPNVVRLRSIPTIMASPDMFWTLFPPPPLSPALLKGKLANLFFKKEKFPQLCPLFPFQRLHFFQFSFRPSHLASPPRTLPRRSALILFRSPLFYPFLPLLLSVRKAGHLHLVRSARFSFRPG